MTLVRTKTKNLESQDNPKSSNHKTASWENTCFSFKET